MGKTTVQKRAGRVLAVMAVCALGVDVVAGQDAVKAVDPYSFTTNFATCAATNRATGEAKDIKICE